MPPQIIRGEVWLVDLGIAGKVRPAAVLSVPFTDQDRALVSIVIHTGSIRGTIHEVAVPLPFLRGKEGVFDCQNILSIPAAHFQKRLGRLAPEQLPLLEEGVKRWLGLP